MERITRCGALVAILALAACNNDIVEPEEEASQINADVAVAVADATIDDIVVMTSESDEAMDPNLHNRCGRLGFLHRCGPRNFLRRLGSGTIMIERDVTFFDAAGDPQDSFDAVLTESINFVVSLSGEWSRDGVSGSIDHDRDFTMSGLSGDEVQRTWNGTGSSVANRTRVSDEAGTRTYELSMNSTVTDVVIPVPRNSGWPLSGTIERHVTIVFVDADGVEQERERTVIVTFNGTQFAEIEINGDTFMLDLESREIIRG